MAAANQHNQPQRQIIKEQMSVLEGVEKQILNAMQSAGNLLLLKTVGDFLCCQRAIICYHYVWFKNLI